MDGGLIGYPTLDTAPYGLDHHREETTHVFRALDVALPRLELTRRAECRQDQAVYYASPDGDVVCAAREETCSQLFEPFHALARVPIACIDTESFSLSPGEQAIAPCRWDRPVPTEDFGCAVMDSIGSKVEVLPGVCPGGKSEVMLCVENTGP